MSSKIEILEDVPVNPNMEFYMNFSVSETLSIKNEDSGMDSDVSMGSSLARQGDRRFTHYENLDKCIMEVRNKTTTKAAAALTYNIPLSKIKRELERLHKQIKSKQAARGTKPIFSPDQESLIVKWIIDGQQMGMPRDFVDILDFINNYAIELNLTLKTAEITRGWFKGFFKRQPTLRVYKASHISHKSAQVPLKNLQHWLMTTEIFMTRKDRLRAIINCPEHWWNSDETAMFLNMLSKCYIGAKGLPVIVVDGANSKARFTATYTACATGEIIDTQILVNKITEAEIRKIERLLGGNKTDP